MTTRIEYLNQMIINLLFVIAQTKRQGKTAPVKRNLVALQNKLNEYKAEEKEIYNNL
jgi:hypothetical protein